MQLTALLDATAGEVDVSSAPSGSAGIAGSGVCAGRSSGTPCQVFEAELWFAETPSDVELAKLLCQDCPVKAACLSGALQRREPWGVWGGELFQAGVVIPRKRPRGRPRKSQTVA